MNGSTDMVSISIVVGAFGGFLFEWPDRVPLRYEDSIVFLTLFKRKTITNARTRITTSRMTAPAIMPSI
jgi:hypothetical protein